MNEYRQTDGNLWQKTSRRLAWELLAFSMMAALLFSDLSSAIPRWATYSMLGGFAAYILIGLACYPRAKSMNAKLVIFLDNDCFRYTDGSGVHRIPYTDISISKIEKSGDRVARIEVRTKFNQSIELAGFDRMDELCGTLVARLRDTAET